jgi:hypothetical protein
MTATQNPGHQSPGWPQQSESAPQPQQDQYAPQASYGAALPETAQPLYGAQYQKPYEPYGSQAAMAQAPYSPHAAYPVQPQTPYAPQAAYDTQPQVPYAPQTAYAAAPQPQYSQQGYSAESEAAYPAPNQTPYAPEVPRGLQPQSPYATQTAYANQPPMPYPPQGYYGAQPAMPTENSGGSEKKAKFGKLAWAALILGIVGVVGSFVPILGYITMFGAVVGAVLGFIAFFGSRKILSAIAVVVCVLAIIITVSVTKAFGESVDDSLGSTAVATSSSDTSSGKSNAKDDAPSNVYKFGQTIKFTDGSTLRVDKPVKFTPDQYAVTGEKKPLYLKFKATFVNKTNEVYDPSLTTASASANGEESESVYQDGLDTPDNKVLPGKSVSWWMGYGVTSQNDLQLQVGVGFLDYDTVIFTN